MRDGLLLFLACVAVWCSSRSDDTTPRDLAQPDAPRPGPGAPLKAGGWRCPRPADEAFLAPVACVNDGGFVGLREVVTAWFGRAHSNGERSYYLPVDVYYAVQGGPPLCINDPPLGPCSVGCPAAARMVVVLSDDMRSYGVSRCCAAAAPSHAAPERDAPAPAALDPAVPEMADAAVV